MFVFKREDAKRVERSKSGHPIYIYDCSVCSNELRVRHFRRKTDKCRICSQIKKPYLKSYSNLVYCAARKGLRCDISYEDFLKYVSVKKCHYCFESINWKSSSYSKYHLDRMDNSKGYSVDNCVVSCTKCNYAKGDRYSYKEWYGMTKYFRSKILRLKEITKEKHDEIVKKVKPVAQVEVDEESISGDQIGCAEGACPIK